MFVLKPTGTIYYSLGLAAEKPAGSSTDLLFFPAFLSHFSTFRLKTKLLLSLSLSRTLPPPSSTHPSSSFLRQQSRQGLQCVRERVKRRGKSREEDCLAGAECLFMFGCFAIGRRVKGHEEKRGACPDAILCHVTTCGP